MLTVLLSILKIIGIILLCILLLILVILLLVLFVPVRYRIDGYRKVNDDVPVRASARITWLFHILNITFRYPEEAFIRVRIFCFTVFSTQKSTDRKQAGKKKSKKEETESKKTVAEVKVISEKKQEAEKTESVKQEPAKEEIKNTPVPAEEKEENSEEKPALLKFIRKLFAILKNIKYTIRKICDKIKHIIKNIRYYIDIIKSDSFKNAWTVCGGKAILLLKSILPGKLTGNFTIGTGDPASTAQILSIWGILYPLIGNHINIVPDFNNSIIEGDFFIQGKITVFKVLKTAIIVYFHKDLRRVIRLFKKEAA
ncbi:MAG: DUF2953 domain-containing protein [Lachnospiraceae bacterium]|nr:DUF2953 domain-containing protein [Lachnospiraceae bacterium]